MILVHTIGALLPEMSELLDGQVRLVGIQPADLTHLFVPVDHDRVDACTVRAFHDACGQFQRFFLFR